VDALSSSVPTELLLVHVGLGGSLGCRSLHVSAAPLLLLLAARSLLTRGMTDNLRVRQSKTRISERYGAAARAARGESLATAGLGMTIGTRPDQFDRLIKKAHAGSPCGARRGRPLERGGGARRTLHRRTVAGTSLRAPTVGRLGRSRVIRTGGLYLVDTKI